MAHLTNRTIERKITGEIAKLGRAALLSALAAAACTSPLLAADPFAGTWQLDPSKNESATPLEASFQSDGKTVVLHSPVSFSTANLTTLRYDGKEYAGSDGSKLQGTAIDDHTVSYVSRKNGQLIQKSTGTVSKDERQLQNVVEDVRDGKTFRMTRYFERIGSWPGGHKIVGRWRWLPAKNQYDPPVTNIIKIEGDSFDLTADGRHVITAKFDGKEYKQDNGNSVWQLKRIDASTIETSKKERNGRLVTERWQVKANLLTTTAVGTDPNGKPGRTVRVWQRVP